MVKFLNVPSLSVRYVHDESMHGVTRRHTLYECGK